MPALLLVKIAPRSTPAALPASRSRLLPERAVTRPTRVSERLDLMTWAA